MLREPDHNFCTGFPLCHWLIFFSVQLSLDAGKIRFNVYVLDGLLFVISEPQAGSGTNSRVKGGFLYVATISLKRVTEMTLELLSIFIEASQNFRYNFLNKKEAKHFFKHHSAHTESIDLIFEAHTKNIHLVTNSLLVFLNNAFYI